MSGFTKLVPEIVMSSVWNEKANRLIQGGYPNVLRSPLGGDMEQPVVGGL